MKNEDIFALIRRGDDLEPLLESGRDTPLCANAELFSAASVIGKGRNGTVYFVPTPLAARFFGSPIPVVLKEIKSRRLVDKLRQQCLTPDGDYICPSQIVSELLNGVVLSQLVADGATPHFVKQLQFFTCKERCFLVSEFCGDRLKDRRYTSRTLS